MLAHHKIQKISLIYQSRENSQKRYVNITISSGYLNNIEVELFKEMDNLRMMSILYISEIYSRFS